ncbi:unnamed protein product [Rhizophagus irregularis]|nr:unnamed protein product [Rhizophagus irregularis]
MLVRKKSSPIESLDPEIFTFKVEALWKAFDLNEKELPGLRNGRLRREGTSWTSKWTLETRRTSKWTLETRRTSKWTLETRRLRNGRLRQEGMLPEVFYIKMFIIIPFFCRNAV